jgi:hypothetical protein
MTRARAWIKLAIIAVSCSSGCASWRYPRRADADVVSPAGNGGLFDWLSGISTNNWNFQRQPYDMRTDEQILGVDPIHP